LAFGGRVKAFRRAYFSGILGDMAQELQQKSTKLYGLLIALVAIEFAFEKNVSDPVNPIKLWIMGALASWAIAKLVTDSQFHALISGKRIVKIYCGLVAGLIGFMLLNFLVMPVKSIGLFGDSGRSLGLLYYLFLACIGYYALSEISINTIQQLYRVIIVLTAILSVYGFLQNQHIDFIQWVTSYNPITLFTGNPDFSASLLGFFGVICFTGLFLSFRVIVKIVIGLISLFDFLVVYLTGALQGLAVLAIGIGIVLLVVVFQRSKRIALSIFLLELFLGIISILGTVNIGVLGHFFYKASVVDRGYDWRAAIHMLKSHPWLGVGIDHYSGYFLQYRSAKYPLIYGYFQSGNNAHNVILQIFATCGLFAGLIYVVLFLFISYRGYKAVRIRSGTEQIIIAGIFAAWVGFVAQQVISIDFAAISVWGWVFGAGLVKLSSSALDSAETGQSNKNLKQPKLYRKSRASRQAVLRPLIFGITLLVLGFVVAPMHRNLSQPFEFHQTPVPNIEGGRQAYLGLASRIFNLPLLNPNDKLQVATDLAVHGFGSESVSYLKKTISADSRNSNAHLVLADVYEHLRDYPNAIIYRLKVAQLDPYGADNLLQLENDYLLVKNIEAARFTRDSIIAMAPGTDVAKRAVKFLTN
jgi:O-antigen ligase